jgi:multisubunit Na+/H+ antiporter MnhG subunit
MGGFDVAMAVVITGGTAALAVVRVLTRVEDRSKMYTLTTSFVALALGAVFAGHHTGGQLALLFEWLAPFDLGLGVSLMLQWAARGCARP